MERLRIAICDDQEEERPYLEKLAARWGGTEGNPGGNLLLFQLGKSPVPV